MRPNKLDKFGFGMSPPRSETQEKRNDNVAEVVWLLSQKECDENSLDALSDVKGLFTRVVKQDQWDWFIVFEQLGRPGIKFCERARSYLSVVRNNIKNQKETIFTNSKLNAALIRILEKFPQISPSDAEQIYILSTREAPDVLKIGFTTRSVIHRANEINSATGVLVPFGVRAVWRVKDARDFEKKIHKLFEEYRIRKDKEFFKIPFSTAFRMVNDFLSKQRVATL